MRFLSTYIWLIAFVAFISTSCTTTNQGAASHIYSKNVKDSFELYVDLPEGYKPDTGYSVVFYMDANLKSGNELRRQIRLSENKERLSKVIFVGIGHIGNYRILRRRDFLPPEISRGTISQSTDPEYGHAESFYNFLEDELIPFIAETYPNNGRHTLIGHSFSGLFAFYCLLKPSPLFTNYVAISPSLWVNSSDIFEWEEKFNATNNSLKATLYHSCGTGEWANRVLSSSRKMKQVLKDRNYEGLNYIYAEHKRKTHHATVPVSLEYVLRNISL